VNLFKKKKKVVAIPAEKIMEKKVIPFKRKKSDRKEKRSTSSAFREGKKEQFRIEGKRKIIHPCEPSGGGDGPICGKRGRNGGTGKGIVGGKKERSC